MQKGNEDGTPRLAAEPRRSIIVKRLGSGQSSAQGDSPLSIANLRRKQLERNNMQLALSRQRVAAERNRLKKNWHSEVEANLMLRQANCQLQTRLRLLEERVQKLEAASAQQAEAQLIADRETVAASRVSAAAAAAAAATAASAAAASSPVSTVSDGQSDTSSAVPSPEPQSVVESANITEIADWFSSHVSASAEGSPQLTGSPSSAAVLFATGPRTSEPELELDQASPQPHDLSIVPPDGYSGRSRRRAALAASTNLTEPGLHSKMTQGMRKRNQLPGRRGAYDDAWSADAASYMVHKEA